MSFGQQRHRTLLAVVSALLIAVTLGAIASWYVLGGRINGSILIPALLGITALLQRRSGTVEYLPERRELRVERKSIARRGGVRVPVSNLSGLTIMTSDPEDVGAVPRLCLLRHEGGPLELLRTSDAAELEAARSAVSAFLLDEGLLGGDRESGPAAHIRVEPATEPEPAVAMTSKSGDSDDADTSDDPEVKKVMKRP